MEKITQLWQFIVGSTVALIWFFQPVHTLLMFTFGFMFLDFMLGMAASWNRLCLKWWNIQRWWNTKKFWTWFYRTSFSAIMICIALILEIILQEFGVDLKLPYVATLVVCVACTVSIARNGGEISKWELLKVISQWLLDLGKQAGEALKRMVIRKIDNI